MVLIAFLNDAENENHSLEIKPTNLLVVILGKTLNSISWSNQKMVLTAFLIGFENENDS